jgi:preprotein translocase subunit SecD
MFGTLKGRFLIIALVVIGSVAVLLTRGITRGLDLSGGMYLALEVQDPEGTMTPEVLRQHTEQNLHILRNRIDQFGVSEPNVQRVGDYRIIVELPGATDLERARDVIAQTAFLEWQLVADLQPLINALPRMDRAVLAALGPDADRALAEVPTDTTRGLQQDVRERLFGTQRDTAAGDTAAADTAAAPPARTPLSDMLRGGERRAASSW